MIVGEPNFFSSTTLCPRGPTVIFTAFATLSTPASSLRHTSSPKTNCFAIFLPPKIYI
ncbi:hypothetical protein HP1_107 [Candidatus Termititenax spirochaetophilus]|uniref:Uncharacterized protein n=1 Tax=Candidatus Termititenax spirochaetophilus TaxID=2218522 RepID=A0A388T8C0_9BACT|nr:hypothetical protein HP1_107 [Candidatus Termititenax spirochaetophilus]